MGIEDGQDEQLIARAVRGAMRLPPASPEARARVLAAVEAEWRTTLAGPEPVAPRRRRVPLARAASLLVGLLAVGAAWQARVSAEPALAVAAFDPAWAPRTATRPKSLRARSTSIKCSARSFGSASNSSSSA